MSHSTDVLPGTQASALAQDLRTLVSKLKRRLREQAQIGDLTPSQVSILLRLEKTGPATASSLARAEGMRAQSVRPVIIALQEAGFVIGQPDSNDGRQTVLSLTDTCLGWIREGRAARQDWLSRTIGARLSQQQQVDVAKAVELLKGLVED